MEKIMEREAAWELLLKHTKSESLKTHAKSVSAAMAHFAKLFNEDDNYWALVGLLHDIDYEEHPHEHCQFAPAILKEAGFDDDFIRAVLSHGYGLCTEVEPQLKMEKVIYAVDELTGFITACALMRPSKSVMDLEYKSVNKKFKTASFASNINRDVIKNGAAMIPMDFEEFVTETIYALREVADEIGLGLEA
ncbi:MAG: HDIG domain-containing protein [Oscillospiraceae bacterium]